MTKGNHKNRVSQKRKYQKRNINYKKESNSGEEKYNLREKFTRAIQ